MKPKASKFRIRSGRSYSKLSHKEFGIRLAEDVRGEEVEGATEQMPEASAGASEPETAAAPERELTPAEELDVIRSENLTGRQLRMARRVAQKHGLQPASDIDAVRILRRNGIDPFQKSSMLELVVTEQRAGGDAAPDKLPATYRAPASPPGETTPIDHRAREIRRIQQDITRRRRVRLGLLAMRLAFFVLLPTLLAGYYYFRVATPMYSTHSHFVIQQAESQTIGGGFLSGTTLATSQDSIVVQDFLHSREAMVRLDEEHGFKAHFSQPWIDPIQRLDADATNEAAYKLYKNIVRIGYDPSEGVVKMEVKAADPEVSATFSRALISYAEEQVDGITERKRADQMQGARASYEEAERKMREAQRRVVELQQKRGVLSAEMEVTSQMSQISALEVELQSERLKLEELLDNARPNRTRVEVTERNIARLERVIGEMRDALTQGDGNTASLATITGELVVAEADLQTRQALLSQALQQLENARIEANRQVRYLSLNVRPVVPDEPSYPRAFENTLLAFLIFGGIYLMASMTASILREQVSA